MIFISKKLILPEQYLAGTTAELQGNASLHHKRFSLKKQDLPGIVHPKGQSPSVIFLPSCDRSHIPGSLDPVAPFTEDLKIITGPLITIHGDRPDVIQDVVMMSILTSGSVAFMELLFAVSTLPFLLKPDKSPHFGNRGPLFVPILPTTGGLAANGILVPGIEV